MSQTLLHKQNWMHPVRWIPPTATSLLDVGCNAGELLQHCRDLFPTMQLAGVEVNQAALEQARLNLPQADLRLSGAQAIPFAESSFDCVTCIEVLEHIPESLRASSLAEIRRVLRPGGRFILRVPHAGIFSFLDANNFRFLMPKLYRMTLRQGRRDAGYLSNSEEVVWHQHFTRKELQELLGDGWEIEASRTGGLLLLPLMDIASWPFYRLRRTDNMLFRAVQRILDFDMSCDYGRASFDILLVLKRA